MIQEFCHVRARRRSRAEAAAQAQAVARGLAPLVRPDETELFQGLQLFRASSELSPFDAVLAATALGRGWAPASADRAFAAVPGLAHLDPSRPTFLSAARESPPTSG
ncbi:MAG: PIN domain-containing protein [Candidatus Dormibacteria bacterium]